jgi:hypothetical protein
MIFDHRLGFDLMDPPGVFEQFTLGYRFHFALNQTLVKSSGYTRFILAIRPCSP